MDIRLSFRDLSNILVQTEMDNEEIRMLTDIPERLSEALGRNEAYSTYVGATGKLKKVYHGNVFDLPVHDNNGNIINIEFTNTAHMEQLRNMIYLALPDLVFANFTLTRLYFEADKYQTIIEFIEDFK